MEYIENLQIIGGNTIGSILKADYTRIGENTEGESLYQWYIDGEGIEGANNKEYQALEVGNYTVAVLPVDSQGNEGGIVYSADYLVEVEIKKPIEKEYLIKVYDKSFNFLKVVPSSIITDDINITESINEGQGQLVLNLNLPIDTDYLDDVKYLRVFMSDNRGTENKLLYTGYLSKYSRLFSNNKENVQATFLSVYSLLSEVYFRHNNQEDFTLEDIEPATVIKEIIDYFNNSYPWLITYTDYSIDDYGNNVNVEVNGNKCNEVLTNILDGLNYYLFIGADGICYFKPKPTEITHNFTYWKDITSLTVPEDYEQVINAVRVQYWYLGGPHSGITSRAEDQESIEKFWRREKTVVNGNIYGNTAGEIYRDSILAKYSKGKQNIRITINNEYPIETIHPWDTIKVRNIGLDINGLQVVSVSYNYEEVVLGVEYQSNLAQEIFSNN